VGNQPDKLLCVTVSLLFYLILNIRLNKIPAQCTFNNLCENRYPWLPTNDNLSGLGQLVQWSVTQNDVSLIVTWPVWYVL